MGEEIEMEPIPPPPTEPTVEDAYQAISGIILPKRAKKFKRAIRFIGIFELILGGYMGLFGIVTCSVTVTLDKNVNIGIYSGVCGVGAFMLASGGFKLSKYKSPRFLNGCMCMSILAALLNGTIIGLCVWKLVVVPEDEKIPFLPGAVAAISVAVMTICLVHAGFYWRGASVPLNPLRAVMYTNIHTGEQIVEYRNTLNDKKEREKRSAESFKKTKNEESFPFPTGSSSKPGKLRTDKNIPITPIIQSASFQGRSDSRQEGTLHKPERSRSSAPDTKSQPQASESRPQGSRPRLKKAMPQPQGTVSRPQDAILKPPIVRSPQTGSYFSQNQKPRTHVSTPRRYIQRQQDSRPRRQVSLPKQHGHTPRRQDSRPRPYASIPQQQDYKPRRQGSMPHLQDATSWSHGSVPSPKPHQSRKSSVPRVQNATPRRHKIQSKLDIHQTD